MRHLEMVFIAAAPSGPELTYALAARLNCTVLQGFSMTELSPVSHLVPFNAPVRAQWASCSLTPPVKS